MENRNKISIALDKMLENAHNANLDVFIQPIELIPFDDREYQLQLRLVANGAIPHNVAPLDKAKLADMAHTIGKDSRLGTSNEIILEVQDVILNNKAYKLQVALSSTHIIEGDKLWNV